MNTTRSGREYHIACSAEEIGQYCLLPGDPGRCEKIAAYFDAPQFIARNREFTCYTGFLDGEKVSVVSTGIGGPSAAIAMEELIHLGAKEFLRVGTCGGIATKVRAGDLILAQSAVRQEGTSYEYAPPGYPATADFDLLRALDDAASVLGLRHHVGVVQAKDSFYGQHSPETMPTEPFLKAKWDAYIRLGVLGSEMESAALYTVAAARGVRCAAVFSVLWNQERIRMGLDDAEKDRHLTADAAIRCAVEALRKRILEKKSQTG